jgi:glycosyltransferase involved in cell wall biosynthesis
MKKISVLHILNKSDLSQGGPPRAVLNLINSQNQCGINSYLISTCKNYPLLKGKKIIIGRHIINRFSIPNLKLIFQTIKLIKKCDIVHVHCFWNVFSTLSILFSRFYKKIVILSPHGTLDLYNIKNKSFFLKKLFFFLVDKKNLEYCQGIHFLSEEEKKNSIWINIKNKYVITQSNSLNLKNITSSIKKNSNNNQTIFNNFKINKFNIVFLGRIDEVKGLDFQIDIINILLKKNYDCHLHIIGPDSKYRQFLEKKIISMQLVNNVTFYKPIYTNLRYKILNYANLVLSTSYYECNSVSNLETIACSGVLVSSTTCNLEHPNKYKCIIYLKRDINLFAKKIISLFNSKILNCEIRKNANLYSKLFLDHNTAAIKFKKFYIQNLNQHSDKNVKYI